ncbi:MAG TPA: hypothetical protein ENJ19_11005 [Gammaproteobacteria bacterium]|nr:hypothetical protein [Gammaproteobacteria bacterium]
MVLLGGIARAEFPLDFNGHPDGAPAINNSWASSTCNRDGFGPCSSGFAGYNDNDPTPFLYETVNIDGTDYVHVVIGDPSQGFAQDTYVEGAVSSITPAAANAAHGFNSGIDPLNGGGNGSGNPEKVVMRQLVSDGEVTIEFLKDALSSKPKISQTVTTPEVTAVFETDMRSIDYKDISTAAPIINTVSLTGPNAPEDMVDFNVGTGSQNGHITAGRYTYTPGPGTLGSEGSYTYWEGDVNVEGVDWSAFRDPAQNP